ncbi:MAG: disulfide bond formation protein B [Magnetococcales bacterium]|nr:disulfide bond formation protein B [Magnetococcales bacterium]
MVVASATHGSLFFSEVMGVPVCVLCWYQRIALSPLTFILAVGLFPYDPKVVRYAGVLTGMGWVVALFHVLLVAGVIPEKIHPCVQGIPCSETHLVLFGFLTIPLMSLLTFTLVAVLLFFSQRMKSS